MKLRNLVIPFTATVMFGNMATGQQVNSVAPEPTPPVEKDLPFLQKNVAPVHNLFIITLDGFRWQELFNGADQALLNNEKFTPGNSLLNMLYMAATPEERRKKLMPFFWNVIAANGQIYGNRLFDNNVNVANPYAKSYPGYNEIFTGVTDPGIFSNKKILNPNQNVLEYLNTIPGFEKKVVAFTSWDVFPYILNEQRSGILVNSGYDTINASMPSKEEALINRTELEGEPQISTTRFDQLTFLVAKEYIRKNSPRVTYLGLGETDEFAHLGRYDLYLEQANKIDMMLAELWHWVQTTPGYAGNTTFLITTDHGRGRKNNWTSHGEFITGSTQTWLAVMGPRLQPLGEMKERQQLYQQQLATAIAHLVGEEF
ncbi:MAG: hypothetical protein ABIR78_07820 [Ferruginibacter sp.]